MKNLSKKVLEKIKQDGLKPIPKWRFLAKEWFLWLFFVILVLVGGLAASIVIYEIVNNEWEIAPYLSDNLTSFVLLTLPYFWILLLIVFSLLADYQIKKTKEGYRYGFVWILLLNILFSLGLGTFLYMGDFSNKIEEAFENYVPYYRKMSPPKQRLWMNPERGLLIGRILDHGSGAALLEDLDGREWEIEIGPDLFWDGEIGDIVRLMGESHSDNLFKTQKMKDWTGPDLFRRPLVRRLLKDLKRENTLMIELIGDGEGDFEASIKVIDDNTQSSQEFFESPEILGQKHTLEFSVGDDKVVDKVTVKWGSGAVDKFEDVKVGEILKVEEK